jgi:hypothetical protein
MPIQVDEKTCPPVGIGRGVELGAAPTIRRSRVGFRPKLARAVFDKTFGSIPPRVKNGDEIGVGVDQEV